MDVSSTSGCLATSCPADKSLSPSNSSHNDRYSNIRRLLPARENLSLVRQSDIDIELPAQLSLREPLGAETLITVSLGSAEMIARVSAQFHQPVGAALTLHVNPNHLHLFDRKSGQALGH